LPIGPLSPDQLIASNTRSRAVLFALAVLVPSGCHAAFERQARRLDALADHGVATTATVTGSRAETVDYAYVVDGANYTWNVPTVRVIREGIRLLTRAVLTSRP
jgi:hypothetical protein